MSSSGGGPDDYQSERTAAHNNKVIFQKVTTKMLTTKANSPTEQSPTQVRKKGKDHLPPAGQQSNPTNEHLGSTLNIQASGGTMA